MDISGGAVRKGDFWKVPGWLVTLILVVNLLSSVIADKSAADYYVTALPGQPEGPLLTMHAG